MSRRDDNLITLIKNHGACSTSTTFIRCEMCYLESQCNVYMKGSIPEDWIYQRAIEHFLSEHTEEDLVEVLL